MNFENQSQEFDEGVSHALTVLQLIEENLKLYIRYSFKLIRVKLDISIPFKFNGDEYENSALETLIKIFSKLSDNEELIKSLHKITGKRNFIAHQAMVQYIKGPNDGSYHNDQYTKIKNIAVEAWQRLALLQVDIDKLNERIMSNKC